MRSCKVLKCTEDWKSMEKIIQSLGLRLYFKIRIIYIIVFEWEAVCFLLWNTNIFKPFQDDRVIFCNIIAILTYLVYTVEINLL